MLKNSSGFYRFCGTEGAQRERDRDECGPQQRSAQSAFRAN